ncbi:hypothetical protein DVH05_008613 [Phytophthora capsici]|nr:hypothetical protein DVH05_008613 [Phytophthora capsici]
MVATVFAPEETDPDHKEEVELRKEMKYEMGLTTRWDKRGLVCQIESRLLGLMTEAKKRREELRGELIHSAVLEQDYHQLRLRDARGEKQKWTSYRRRLDGHKVQKIKDIIRVENVGQGKVLMTPQTVELPMESRQAHMFREIALSLLAQFPELISKPDEENKLRVKHKLDDQHHRFWVEQSTGEDKLYHGWAFEEQEVAKGGSIAATEANIAALLQTRKEAVWVAPHPALTHMRPLWTGKRRWSRARRDYKGVIAKRRKDRVVQAQELLTNKLANEHKELHRALTELTWKHVQRLHGVTSYQKQNIVRMKMGRLRLWNGTSQDYACVGARCAKSSAHGQAHLLWQCPDARAIWSAMLELWGMPALEGEAEHDKEAIQDIFALKLSKLPAWLIEWGNEQHDDRWNEMHEVAGAVWTMGCATMITALWRWKVAERYPDGNTRPEEVVEIQRTGERMKEVLLRYRAGLFPLSARSYKKLTVVERIRRQWADVRMTAGSRDRTNERVLLGFFDGGSRGNPGPGGSGSVLVEWEKEEEKYKVVWAAATSLSSRHMTNNVAEFVGLQQLLVEAVAKQWSGMHVIGDSAMILGLLKRRREPRAKRLKHWYQLARKLADQLQITEWRHHYRRHNKTADWLANYAMDTNRSVVYGASREEQEHELRQKAEQLIAGDCEQWRSERDSKD